MEKSSNIIKYIETLLNLEKMLISYRSFLRCEYSSASEKLIKDSYKETLDKTGEYLETLSHMIEFFKNMLVLALKKEQEESLVGYIIMELNGESFKKPVSNVKYETLNKTKSEEAFSIGFNPERETYCTLNDGFTIISKKDYDILIEDATELDKIKESKYFREKTKNRGNNG